MTIFRSLPFYSFFTDKFCKGILKDFKLGDSSDRMVHRLVVVLGDEVDYDPVRKKLFAPRRPEISVELRHSHSPHVVRNPIVVGQLKELRLTDKTGALVRSFTPDMMTINDIFGNFERLPVKNR